MPIPWIELDGSPTESFGRQGIKATRNVLCPWDQRRDGVAEILGQGYVFGGESVGFLPYPDINQVVAVNVNIVPFHDKTVLQPENEDLSEFLQQYQSPAKITINYELIETEAREMEELPAPEIDTFLTYSVDIGGETILVPVRGLGWTDTRTDVWGNGTLEDYVAAGGDDLARSRAAEFPKVPSEQNRMREEDTHTTKRVTLVEHHLDWHRVAYPPYLTMRKKAGKVNKVRFLGGEPHTMLFMGATVERQFYLPWGINQYNPFYKVSYLFSEKLIHETDTKLFGWNTKFRSDPAAARRWVEAVDANGNLLYPMTELDSLFSYANTPI